MAEKTPKKRRSGFFGKGQLPVTGRYLYPGARSAMYIAGGVGLLLVLAVFTLDTTVRDGMLISNGPLSSDHALFGSDCSTCHTPFSHPTNEKCGTCHEKYGDEIGTYSFTSHYLYRTGDFTRVVPSPDEPACFTCHAEHAGAENVLTNVGDEFCLQCHAFGSFNKDHPEFRFAVEQEEDPANLKFTHSLHVRQVRERENVGDIEKTCLYCHNAEADGTQFQPIDFDRHCDACHLTSSVASEWLTVAAPGDTASPGVLTLETIRAGRAPGTRWADYTNPNEFQRRSDRVRKTPLYHEDPWILENLKRIRSILYPSAGLADLLKASPEVAQAEVRRLYEEAIATLSDHAEALRAQPEQEIQDELAELERLIEEVRRRLDEPYAPLDETRFLVSAADVNPHLTDEQVQAFEGFVDELTQPCQQCHLVENATLVRAQAEQEVLTRAAFNHRAHIIHSRCLDCHTEIPIQRFAAAGQEADPSLDHAGIQNLPRLASCQTCHADGKASNACITCHLFHPDQSHQSNLLLYRE